jgi:Polysaccharide deacetylase
MRADNFVCLMYHDLGTEVVPGRPPSPSHLTYVVSGAQFAKQLAYLRSAGWKGCKVSDALQGTEHAVALTFDDGSSTDIELAAPALSYAGFTATFYVVTSKVGTLGYLSPNDIRSLAKSGFEIGSHSVTHAYLPSLTLDQVRRELRDSKDQLEQWLGLPTRHFSCPLGGYTPVVATIAEEIGYASVATSQVGVNAIGAVVLNRIAIRRNTSLSSFGRMCAGKALLYPRARQAVLAGVRSTIGFAAYSALCGLASRSQGRPAETGEKVS